VYNPSVLRRGLPRIGDLLFVAVFVGSLVLGQRMLNTDGDLGRHLTLGNFILDAQRVPVRDVLSFTRAGTPRPPYEWLAQVVFAMSDRLLGLDGVVLLTALIIACSCLVVLLDAVDRTHSPFLSLVMGSVAAVASSLHWLTRPHVFTFLFLALWLAGLERWRSGKRMPLWLFPVLMLIWGNTHGGFVFGFLAWGAYMANWLIGAIRHSPAAGSGWSLLLVGATSAVASMITPDFWHNWQAVLENRSAYVLSRTAEATAPNFSQSATWPFLGLLAFCVVGLALDRRRAVAAHVLLLGGFTILAFAAARNIPLFAIAAAPVGASWIANVASSEPKWQRFEAAIWKMDHGLTGFMWPVVVALLAGVTFAYRDLYVRIPVYNFSAAVFPAKAIDWEQHHVLPGRMFNDLNWGGYLLYRLWPSQRVFIDSQTDFYGEEFVREYEALILAEPGWPAVLDHYHIGWAIIPTSSKLADQLASSSDWRSLYSDSTASIYGRVAAP
jgi:hypothetical protein